MSFVQHTVESAPAGSRRFMTVTADRLGYLPAAIGLLAESPHLLEGFLKLSALFETTSLAQVEREVVIMTMATRNDCHICIAMHTRKLTDIDAEPELIAALREDRALADPHLDALRRFVLELLASRGAPSDESLRDFLGAGYTTQNALEVVLGIGTYTMSTFANRLTKAPLDDQLALFAA
ncbi:MAG TPA: carboxymuconolactone decarboxylase family protein [Pseudonocardiaceae bacterium]|nr:carboxymuconolactone decarboxylase family protein [Pseudonocardiaceae bacterium]